MDERTDGHRRDPAQKSSSGHRANDQGAICKGIRHTLHKQLPGELYADSIDMRTYRYACSSQWYLYAKVALCCSTLKHSLHRLQVLMQLKEDDGELGLGLAQRLQQRRKRRRAPRRFWVRPWILRRGGVSLGTSDASPSF